MIEASKSGETKRLLKYGMVGGGPGAFIGAVHRAAIAQTGEGVLVAGCFSRNPETIEQAQKELRIDGERNYRTYQEMAEKEAKREDCIDFVIIVTPNVTHYPIAKAFLEQGINVMCEKPLTVSLEQALDLKRIAEKNGCLFGLTYTNSGHVMAKEARALIRGGEIGEILSVMAEYPQEWLIDLAEKQGSRQAGWRTDPEQAGISNCIGDIGTHVENTVSYFTGLKIKKLCAVMDIIGEGRKLDTNSTVMLKFDNGATGSYWCSQIAVGCENGLKVRVFGTKGSIEFMPENNNYLKVMKKGQPLQIYSRGNEYIAPQAAAFSRYPSGHGEGLCEAFGNIYRAFMSAVHAKSEGKKVVEADYDYPNIDAGIDGVLFIEKCVESAKKDSAWVEVR